MERDRVYHREDRRVGADPKREDDDHDGGERRSSAQGTQRELEV
ncbi:MAG: hypothetical protein JWM53_6025 [bacterium]|nr:hypothetical protein [bacterium]